MEAKQTKSRRGKKLQEDVVTAEAEIMEEPQKNGTKRKAPERKGKTAVVIEDNEHHEEKAPAKKIRGARGAKEVKESNAVTEEENATAVPAVAPKKGRGKKVVEKVEESSEIVEEAAPPPAKKGRGKTAKDEEPKLDMPEEEIVTAPIAAKKGRGKQTNKDEVKTETADVAAPRRGRAKDKKEEEMEVVPEEKPKGRGRAAKKADLASTETKTESSAVTTPPAKSAPAKKGRGKKAAAATTEEDEVVSSTTAIMTMVETVTKNAGRKKAAIPVPEIELETNGAPEAKRRKPTKRNKKIKILHNTEEEKKATKSSKNELIPNLNDKEVIDQPTEVKVKRSKKDLNGEISVPKKAKMNKDGTDFKSIEFGIEEKDWNFKISTWNVAGLRGWVSKGCLEYFEHEKPDILCLQETKCTDEQLPEETRQIKGYHPYWLCKSGGYAGVAIYSKVMPMSINYGLGDVEQDDAGRLLTAEYEKFYLVCAYVPNAGRKLVSLPKRLRWDAQFQNYLQKLDSKKPVILCGDLNVAHEEIDLKNPKSNKRSAGFTQEERDGMSKMLSLGFVDTFRKLYPDKTDAFTYWTYMANSRYKNVGWRLDYFITSERLVGKVVDNVIRSEIYGSDHCPITLFLNI